MDKLQVWKQALRHLQAATIVTLDDDVKAVHVFNAAWADVVEEAFNAGDWNFAKVSESLSASSAAPALGWSYAFPYPESWLRSVAVSTTPDFRSPFYDYVDEGGYLHANTNVLYLRYISSAKMADEAIATWPTMFRAYVALKLAYDTCGRITSGDTLEGKLEKRMEKALRQAKSVDARNENNKVIAPGSWLRSRHGFGMRHDGSATLVGGEIVLGEGEV